MSDPKYVYLAKSEFVNTWVNGGQLPIQPASAYWASEENRKGAFTPDELLIQDSPYPLDWLRTYSPNITITGCSIRQEDGSFAKIPDVHKAKYYYQDGLVLCLSNSICRSRAIRIGEPYGPRPFVVKVDKVPELFGLLSEQLGIWGSIGPCKYTDHHNRNAFLKSNIDSWQDEFRMYWPINSSFDSSGELATQYVEFPPGFGSLVETFLF